MWWWKMEKKTLRLPESLKELLEDPTVLKVARGFAKNRAASTRSDVVFGVETIDDALRKLREWQAAKAPARKVTK